MSHFTVLVIGPDPEAQLEPYNENTIGDGGKWDWYVIGGRWSGWLLMKPGQVGSLGEDTAWSSSKKFNERKAERLTTGADQALKGQVDWAGMRARAERRALDLYDRVHAVVAGRSVEPWPSVRDRHADIEAARKCYHAQPVIKDLRASKDDDLVWVDIEDYLSTREAHGKRARLNAVLTFAVVKDGQWYERGQMGWFAHVTDEKSDEQWRAEFNTLIDGLPDDTLVTVVDCHI